MKRIKEKTKIFVFSAIREIIHSKFVFRRQLDKLIDFSLQMADSNTTNDDKQLIEVKLVSLIHAIALRTFIFNS